MRLAAATGPELQTPIIFAIDAAAPSLLEHKAQPAVSVYSHLYTLRQILMLPCEFCLLKFQGAVR